ncbi:hypothetical protein Taro_017859, partial [Colocasia esculenta]|nr:hypothetical protein [Colocasia esculenta]
MAHPSQRAANCGGVRHRPSTPTSLLRTQRRLVPRGGCAGARQPIDVAVDAGVSAGDVAAGTRAGRTAGRGAHALLRLERLHGA